jgi:hypothetical protein
VGEEEEERDGGNDENMYNQKVSFKVHYLYSHDGQGFGAPRRT